MNRRKKLSMIRFCLRLLLAGLVFSMYLGPGTFMDQMWPDFASWLDVLDDSINQTYQTYPVVAYCMDYLILAHLFMIIILIGAIRNPVRYLWIITSFWMICLMMIPFTFITGIYLRRIAI